LLHTNYIEINQVNPLSRDWRPITNEMVFILLYVRHILGTGSIPVGDKNK